MRRVTKSETSTNKIYMVGIVVTVVFLAAVSSASALTPGALSEAWVSHQCQGYGANQDDAFDTGTTSTHAEASVPEALAIAQTSRYNLGVYSRARSRGGCDLQGVSVADSAGGHTNTEFVDIIPVSGVSGNPVPQTVIVSFAVSGSLNSGSQAVANAAWAITAEYDPDDVTNAGQQDIVSASESIRCQPGGFCGSQGYGSVYRGSFVVSPGDPIILYLTLASDAGMGYDFNVRYAEADFISTVELIGFELPPGMTIGTSELGIDYPVLSGPPTQCSDRLDNDGDGLEDLDDPGCTGPEDDDESNAPPSGGGPPGTEIPEFPTAAIPAMIGIAGYLAIKRFRRKD